MSFQRYMAEVKSLPKQIEQYHKVLSLEASYLTLNEHFPKLTHDKTFVELESTALEYSQDQGIFSKSVDVALGYLGKLLRALLKGSLYLWQKFMVLVKKLLGYLGIAIRRADRVREGLRMTMTEGVKLVELIKQKTNALVMAGQTHVYYLADWVKLVIDSTGTQSKPLDETNPAAVLQWLESLLLRRINFNRVKGLKYHLPTDKDWYYFNFEKNYSWLSDKLCDFQEKLNNYYYKIIQQLSAYLNPQMLSTIILDTSVKLSQQHNLRKETFLKAVVDRLIEPVFNLEQPYLHGNISHERQVLLRNETPKKLYQGEQNPINGLDRAVSGLFPSLIASDQRRMTHYDVDATTNIDELAEYSVSLKKVMKSVENNNLQLFNRNEQVKKGFILNEQQVFKLLRALQLKDDQLLKEIGVGLLDLVQRIDKVINSAYTFHLQLTTFQLKGLDNQLNRLNQFMPYI